MAIVHSSDIPTDPHVAIRADLWDTMSPQELSRQQELMSERMMHLQMMMGSSSTTQAVLDMYTAMQRAIETLNRIMDSKSKGNFNA